MVSGLWFGKMGSGVRNGELDYSGSYKTNILGFANQGSYSMYFFAFCGSSRNSAITYAVVRDFEIFATLSVKVKGR